jgi:purine-binding chemotaxis protein CheW
MATANTNIAQVNTGDLVSLEMGQDAEGPQYLTFMLAGEHYGVDILRVQEIKGWAPVTRIPNTPEYLRGVLNLRGTIVPILDMRMRFDLENAEYTPLTVIIVLSVHTENGERVIGVVVDSVSDVLNVRPEDIKPTPDFGSGVDTDFLNGLAASGDEMVMLLDVDKMMSADELSSLESLDSEPE